MKSWQKVGAFTLIVLAVFGIRMYFLWKERHAPVVQKSQRYERPLTDDDIVSPRKLLIDDMKSAKTLISKTVWIQAGFELEYFPYINRRINFAHKIGVLPSVQALEIKDIVLETAPLSKTSHIPRGDKQVFAVFQIPGDSKQYTTAIGYIQGNDSTYYCDDIFYYDDPHKMYKHWPTDVWQAVDQHQPKAGMNELQVAMALGVMQQSDSSNYGNRTVHYDAGGKQWNVSFQNNKATNVQAE
jgi:4-amino-4-deoxy-L-arabinose transferase-like glycosyltransferase